MVCRCCSSEAWGFGQVCHQRSEALPRHLQRCESSNLYQTRKNFTIVLAETRRQHAGTLHQDVCVPSIVKVMRAILRLMMHQNINSCGSVSTTVQWQTPGLCALQAECWISLLTVVNTPLSSRFPLQSPSAEFLNVRLCFCFNYDFTLIWDNISQSALCFYFCVSWPLVSGRQEHCVLCADGGQGLVKSLHPSILSGRTLPLSWPGWSSMSLFYFIVLKK